MKWFFSLLLIGFCFSLQAQVEDYTVAIKEVELPGSPGVQSFTVGYANGKWLIVGGRTDGLHLRRPFESFLAADNNTFAYVLDIENKNVWSANLNTLPTDLYEQLQSTNMQHTQVGDLLFITGGYGYSATEGDHTTYPNLTVVDVPGCIQAIINNQPIAPYFEQITDARLQVTGGYMQVLDSTFYLVGGQKFLGRYNPMGPDHGPGFVQEYTNAIKTFRLEKSGGSWQVLDYTEVVDTANLHRRDYNMLPQVFPTGDFGLTAFSGVFRYDADLPWLNTVDITEGGYVVQNGFNQYLNQYHTASLPLYSGQAGNMYSLFFGGISRYYIDANGTMQEDNNVPFVHTISMVRRDSTGLMTEQKIGEMPALLGSGAEFLPNEALPFVFNHVVDVDLLTADSILLGWVFGGIESSAANIFFSNSPTPLSEASNRLFEVWLYKTEDDATALNKLPLFEKLRLSPNPAKAQLQLSFSLSTTTAIRLDVFDALGRQVQMVKNERYTQGEHTVLFRVDNYKPGTYYLRLFDGVVIQTLPFVIE